MLKHSLSYSLLTDTGKNYELHCTRIMWELHPRRNMWKKHWRGTNFSFPRGNKTSHRKSHIFKSLNFYIYSVSFKMSLRFQDLINRVILGENIYQLGPYFQLLQRYSDNRWKRKENSWLSKTVLFDYILNYMEIVIIVVAHYSCCSERFRSFSIQNLAFFL